MLLSATKCRINEPSAPKSSQNPQYKRPCGSGKKYKKCCLNKKENKSSVSNAKPFDNIGTLDIFKSHNEYIHTKEVNAPEINKKLLNIYDNWDNFSTRNVIDDYLEIMNYVLDYAKKNKLRTIKQLDEANMISDSVLNVIGDFNMTLLNLSKNMYDLNIIVEYLDNLVTTLDLEYNTYENSLRCKTQTLFKLGNYEAGEKVMLDLMNKNTKSIMPYVELVDDYEMVDDMKKAKYYYDLGIKRKNLKDWEVLEERKKILRNSYN